LNAWRVADKEAPIYIVILSSKSDLKRLACVGNVVIHAVADPEILKGLGAPERGPTPEIAEKNHVVVWYFGSQILSFTDIRW
jgi:hypothetical protein